MLKRHVIVLVFAILLIFVLAAFLRDMSGTILIVTPQNRSFHFPDAAIKFAPRMPDSGIVGVLFAADPEFGCGPLVNPIVQGSDLPAFLLVKQSMCSFYTKVRHGQDAGFAAVIVYADEDGDPLWTMAGNKADIVIPAVYISKQAGEILLQYAGDMETRCYVFPAFESTAWSVIAVCIMSLLAVLVVLSTVFFVRRHRLQNLSSYILRLEDMGMSKAELRAFPIKLFKYNKNSSSEACAICLEEYLQGNKLRMLPCNHGFHSLCIDRWLMTQRPFCPICKQDVRRKNGSPPASESTPLLDSTTIQLEDARDSSPFSSLCPSEESMSSTLNRHALSCPIPCASRDANYMPLSSQESCDLAISPLQ